MLNAAGALVVGGKADGFKEGIKLAGELIDSKAAEKKLAQLREMSNSSRSNEMSFIAALLQRKKQVLSP